MTQSRYKNNVVTKKGRKTLGYLFDFSITLVLMICFYVLISWVGGYVPSVKDVAQQTSDSQDALYSFVDETFLSKKNSSGRYEDSSTVSEEFVKSNVYYVLKNNGYSDVQISSTSYSGLEPLTPEKDGLYRYYSEYKPNNLSLYNDFDGKNNVGLDYYRNDVLKVSENDYFDDGYPYIKLDVALKIDTYFRESNYKLGYTYYSLIQNAYQVGWDNAIGEVAAYNTTYLTLTTTFEENRIALFDVDVVEIIMSYVLGFLVGYLVPLLIFKDGKTIGFRILNLGFTKKDGTRPHWYNNLFRGLTLFVEEFWLIDIFTIVIFSSSGVYLLMHNMGNIFNIFYYSIFSFLVTISSIIMMFVNKQTKQTISEFLGEMICRDLKEFEVKEENHGNKENRLESRS